MILLSRPYDWLLVICVCMWHTANAPRRRQLRAAQEELVAICISVAATNDSSLQTIYAHATHHADDIL